MLSSMGPTDITTY